MIEVREGRREGDKTAVDPDSLMFDAQLREAFAVSQEARAREAAAASVRSGRAAPAIDPGGGSGSSRSCGISPPRTARNSSAAAKTSARRSSRGPASPTQDSRRSIRRASRTLAPGDRVARSPGGEPPGELCWPVRRPPP
jgi:hypothetical protein